LRPLIYISLSLLAGSLIAPWTWQPVRLGPTPVGPPRPSAPQDDPQLARSVLKRPLPQRPPHKASPPPTIVFSPPTNWEPEPSDVVDRRDNPLTEYEIQPVVVEASPPVAELIELDPSLAEPADPKSSSAHPRPTMPEPGDTPEPEDLETPLPKPVERAPVVAPPKAAGIWPHAEALERQLTTLSEEFPADKAWVDRVIAQLHALAALESLDSNQLPPILARLRQLADEGNRDRTPHAPTRESTLRQRTAFAITRRIGTWDLVGQLARKGETSVSARLSHSELSLALADIARLIDGVPAAKSWTTYLRLNELHKVATYAVTPDADARTLARDVLMRLDSPRLDKQQHAFLSKPPFLALAQALQPAAQDPVDWGGLLAAIEERETNDSSVVSHQIADMYQVTRWSSDETAVRLSEMVNDNHRNANVRIALSVELLNRFVPAPQIMAENVADNVRGADVVGRSESIARLRIVLLPDRLRWRMGLEAHGEVASETSSSKGPARFWNDGLGRFRAWKEVTVDRRGLAVAKAETQANAEAFLKNFETDYDHMPFFSSVVRSIAQKQYEKEQPAAKSEISKKISQRASQKLDHEVDSKMVQAEREFKQKLLGPLDKLNLEPTPVDMQTTERRLIARYRLAGPHQLSAYTPRPQAPSNSMVSLQLHESMFNNTLENLKLADRRVDLRTLYVEMLRRFDAKEIKIPDDLPEDVTVTFADHDPVRIHCEEGRVRLTIRLKELDHAERHVWKDFEVHGYYRPSENQLEANLVRDGNLELVGERLKLGDQIALRGIFAKVLSRNRQLSIVNKQLLMRPQLSDLQVTQFVVQDGWIGVALGPKSDNLRPQPSSPADEAEVARRLHRQANEAEVARRPARQKTLKLR
jgi:hypothetical protein